MITLKITTSRSPFPEGAPSWRPPKGPRFIPTLCHDKRITPYGACRRAVRRKKPGNLIRSCFQPGRDRMDIVTRDTPGITGGRPGAASAHLS